MEIQPSTKTIIARYSASIPLVCEMDFDQFPFDESICKIQMFNSQNSNNTMIFIDDNELDNEEYDQFYSLSLARHSALKLGKSAISKVVKNTFFALSKMAKK